MEAHRGRIRVLGLQPPFPSQGWQLQVMTTLDDEDWELFSVDKVYLRAEGQALVKRCCPSCLRQVLKRPFVNVVSFSCAASVENACWQ